MSALYSIDVPQGTYRILAWIFGSRAILGHEKNRIDLTLNLISCSA